jgi:hypothetical protein
MVGSYLISVRMIDRDAGKEEVLHERVGSRCYFTDWFTYGNYKIQYRLHRNEVRNGVPTLDADIYDKNSGKLLVKERKWHHTKVTIDPASGRETYIFNFLGLKRKLGIIRTMAKDFTADAIIGKEDYRKKHSSFSRK